MKIAIRLDDITPEMDREKFGRMKKLLDETHAMPLLGIVPDCRDPKLFIDPPAEDFWDLMVELERQGWTLSMHGLTHVYTTHHGGLFPLNRQSEFAGLPLKRQEEMLLQGKAILENHGILTDLFMAPSHSYDKNTLRALKTCGFSKITDGFGRNPYEYMGITFYPISFSRGSVLKNREKEGYTSFVFHVNAMQDKEFAAAEKILKEQDILPYRDYLHCEAVRRGAPARAGEYLMALGKRTVMSAKR